MTPQLALHPAGHLSVQQSHQFPVVLPRQFLGARVCVGLPGQSLQALVNQADQQRLQ